MGEREREILARIRARAPGASAGLRVGIGDDAAVLRPRAGEDLVLTTDMSLEGVHFRRAWHEPEAVGYKCLARGLSDLAAMGARPLAAFLSLALPRALARPAARPSSPTARHAGRRSWMDRFYDGLLALAGEFGVPLAGGDLAAAPGRLAMADIVVVGAVGRGRALLRSTARAGDLLWVTGTLGGAAAELRALARSPGRLRGLTRPSPDHPHFFPRPRLAVGRALARRRLATAAIDVSDGLSVDLQHLCQESGLRAEVDAACLPRAAAATLHDALHGGDDYELLFTAAPSARLPRALAGVPLHCIGRMLRPRAGAPEMTLVSGGRRRELRPGGWQHF